MTDLIRRVTEVTLKLSQIAQLGFDLKDITRIWATLPLDDSGESTYLEKANKCILEVSDLIDKGFPDMPQNKKLALKYHIMAALLSLTAEQLDSSSENNV